MNIIELDIAQFLAEPGVIFDVRSPAEYHQGHIPGAINLPLFSDKERALVGTCYKQKGRNEAIELGLEKVGPKLAFFIREAKKELADRQSTIAKIYCWRGGMRSSSISWLLSTVGITTRTLKKGYKTFRRWCLDLLNQPLPIHVLGGLTGSGKTKILRLMRDQGAQILDLEELALHRGSAYGKIEGKSQPSYEQFENSIAMQLATLDPSRPIWIEDESRMIGSCKIPDGLFRLIRKSVLFYIERPLEERLEHLRQEYLSTIHLDELMNITHLLFKRLGRARTDDAIVALQKHDYRRAGEIILEYYDKCYRYGVTQRTSPVLSFQETGLSNQAWALKILQHEQDPLCMSC
jgi:tRNA 2-selenouridine synthase